MLFSRFNREKDMCIYYGDNENLLYAKQEHIFPAGLGGIAMLPKGTVSDQANEFFSPLEQKLMYKSLISMERTFLGPGKRGKLGKKHASKSQISISRKEDGELALGYLSGKGGFYINSLAKQGKQFIFTVATEQHTDYKQAKKDFFSYLDNLENKFVLLRSKDISPDDWLLGIYQKKFYIAMGENTSLEILKNELKITKIKIEREEIPLSHSVGHPRFESTLEESDDTSRVYAKTVINVLAALKGEEYIRHDRFSKIKHWILGELDTNEFTQLPKVWIESPPHVPESSHWCSFYKVNSELWAVICFYNRISRRFKLGECAFDDDFGPAPLGLICDWKNKQEFTFLDWALSIANLD